MTPRQRKLARQRRPMLIGQPTQVRLSPPPLPSYLKQQLAKAELEGVIPTGPDTILARIDAAIATLREAGLGNCKAIYLVESDYLAFRVAQGEGQAPEYRDAPVRLGATSKVYGRNGSRAVRKKPPSNPAKPTP